ncbi:hypothetical protein ATN89_17085 [Comamonas thiooxydans]|nr:hypothetical protein ATN89_17085 [Comamonas thiooxydans]
MNAQAQHQHSDEVGTVIRILPITGQAIVRIKKKKAGEEITAVTAVEIEQLELLPAVPGHREDDVFVSLSYVTRQDGPGWLEAPAPMVRRAGLAGNLYSESRLTRDGGTYYLEESNDAFMLMLFLKMRGVSVELEPVMDRPGIEQLPSAATVR